MLSDLPLGGRCPQGEYGSNYRPSSVSLRSPASPRGKLKTMLPAGRMRVLSVPIRRSAHGEDEGLLITLIRLAALASFPRGKLKTMLPAGRMRVFCVPIRRSAHGEDEGLLSPYQEKYP